MADLGQNIRNMVMKGMEAIGNTANSIASNTKQKVDFYNLQGEKKELLNSIGSKIIELWKQGEKLPDALIEDIEKVILIDEQLKVMQKDKEAEEQEASETADEYKGKGFETKTEDNVPQMEIPQAAEYTAQDDRDVPVIEVGTTEKADQQEEYSPLSSAINDLFEQMPPVDKMAEKVNTSLDELGENLRKFSGELSKGIDQIAEQLTEDDGKKD